MRLVDKKATEESELLQKTITLLDEAFPQVQKMFTLICMSGMIIQKHSDDPLVLHKAKFRFDELLRLFEKGCKEMKTFSDELDTYLLQKELNERP